MSNGLAGIPNLSWRYCADAILFIHHREIVVNWQCLEIHDNRMKGDMRELYCVTGDIEMPTTVYSYHTRHHLFIFINADQWHRFLRDRGMWIGKCIDAQQILKWKTFCKLMK